MKQYNLINQLISKLIEKDYIDAAFLVGSYARRTEDEYSNIDLYLIFKDQRYEDYIQEIHSILSSLNKIIYIKDDVLNTYTMVVDCIYEDNIRLRLHHDYLDTCDPNLFYNDILKIYDPNNMLDDLMKYTLEFSEKEIGEIIERFCLSTFEFNRAYLRHDLAYMLSDANQCFDYFSYIIRYYNNKETSKLGKKEILGDLCQEHRIKYVEVIKKFKADTLKDSVLIMMELVKELSSQMTLTVASYYDYDLMMHVYKNLKLL